MKAACIDPRAVLQNRRTFSHQLSLSSEDREEEKRAFRTTRSVIPPARAQPPVHPSAPVAAVLCLTHIVKYKIYVAVVISFEDIHEANDILMSCQFLEEHDFSERPLSIRSILKGIKDLFQRHSLICAPVRALPHNAICLIKKQTNERITTCWSSHIPADSWVQTESRTDRLPFLSMHAGTGRYAGMHVSQTSIYRKNLRHRTPTQLVSE